jgi:hypothetical protein
MSDYPHQDDDLAVFFKTVQTAFRQWGDRFRGYLKVGWGESYRGLYPVTAQACRISSKGRIR